MSEQAPNEAGNEGGSVTVELPTTLGEDLPRQMARVRDEIMPCYQEIGPAGAFALLMMRQDLDRAAKALASGDLVDMIAAYKALKGYKL